MSKKLRTPLIIATVAIVAFLLLWRNLNHTSSWKPSLFSLKSPNTITKFTLVSNNDKLSPLSFERKNNSWFVSNGKDSFLADTQSVYQLLQWAMPRLHLKTPVSNQEEKHIERNLAVSGTKATFYVNGEAVHTIYVGGPTQDQEATYMYYPNTDRPCIVEIQGYHGYLTPFFNCNINLWRSVYLLQSDPSEIASLQVHWHQFPEKSFSIKRDKDQLTLLDSKNTPVAAKKGLVAGYLFLCKDFAREAGEPAGINHDENAKSAILKSKPFLTFIYTFNNGEKLTFDCYPVKDAREAISIDAKPKETSLNETELFWVKSSKDPSLWMAQDIILKNRMKTVNDFLLN